MSEPQAAPAGESSRIARLENEVRILRQVSAQLNSTLELEDIYEVVLGSMHEAFGFGHSLILLLDDSESSLRVVAARGYPESTRGASVEIGVGVIGTVAKRKKMMRIANLGPQRAYVQAIRNRVVEAGQAETLDPAPALPGLPDAESQIAIPLLIGDRLIGVFFVECSERWSISEHEEALFSIVANQCASAIHNALLYHREQRRREVLECVVTDRCFERAAEDEPTRTSGGCDFADLVGSSEPMVAIKGLLAKLAASRASTILIIGENGTGKDLVAKVVHRESARASAPFMNITCSALAPTLLESELFGHERGAFTDAHKQRKGLLELADGGSVFLDEIAELTVPLQTKLLRFLEDKTFKRVGGADDIRVDVRVIAATNRDLPRMVREGSFREDLYYRLRVLEVEMPPLRERRGDIPLLARLFLRQFRTEFDKEIPDLGADTIAHLEAYPWPGNVRELRNAIERAVLLADGPTLTAADFPGLGQQVEADAVRLPSEGLCFEQLERSLVTQALEQARGNKAKAARLLGMPRDWLRYRLEKFQLLS